MKRNAVVPSLNTANLSDEVIYKIEIPANRCDMLSVEGLSRALKGVLGIGKGTNVHCTTSSHQLIISQGVTRIRPFMVAAVLRNINFTEAIYDSFIDLQDKIHNGIGRRRQIVSMGTHDMDTVQGPFHYDAVAPQDISFVPLNQKS